MKRTILIWLLFLATGAILLVGTGICINLTDSMPLGFYRITPGEVERMIARGCLPGPYQSGHSGGA